MQPATEEFLNLLFWCADRIAYPSFRNLTESYEGWAYRKGLLRRINQLEHSHLVERDYGSPDDRLYRLTAQGRLHALGGRDPGEQWNRPWDGYWRLVAFDVPRRKNTERKRLRRYLRDRGFGFVQHSLWISPHPLVEEKKILGGGRVNVESLLLLEARPCAGEEDSEIVRGAWDFLRINRSYSRLMQLLDDRPEPSDPASFLAWVVEERQAWLEAVTQDPLLPEALLPPGYLGQRAWRKRLQVLAKAGRHLRSFQP